MELDGYAHVYFAALSISEHTVKGHVLKIVGACE